MPDQNRKGAGKIYFNNFSLLRNILIHTQASNADQEEKNGWVTNIAEKLTTVSVFYYSKHITTHLAA